MNTVCDRDWPEDFEHENGEYMNTCCECKNTFTGHKRRFICKACSTSQGGEAVAVVAYIDGGGAIYTAKLLEIMSVEPDGCEPLMAVAQHQRILAAATHPAGQVAEPDAELVRQCIAQELATWEGDFKGPVHTAMRCLQVRIDAKLASLEVKP